MQAEPLIHWPEPIFEFIGFIAQFLAVGSVGFRFAAVRGRLDGASPSTDVAQVRDPGPERAFYAGASARAEAPA